MSIAAGMSNPGSPERVSDCALVGLRQRCSILLSMKSQITSPSHTESLLKMVCEQVMAQLGSSGKLVSDCHESQVHTPQHVLEAATMVIQSSPRGQIPTYLRIKHQLINEYVLNPSLCGFIFLQLCFLVLSFHAQSDLSFILVLDGIFQRATFACSTTCY